MLRVLHVDTGREWRGGQNQVFGLLRALRDEPGLEQILCAPPGSPLIARATEIGVAAIPLPLRGEFDLRSSRALRREIIEREIDVVHTHDAHAHGIALRAARPLVHVRLVVHRRVDFPIRSGWLGRRKHGPRVDRYVAISAGVAGVLTDCGIPPGKIEIIPSGIDTHRFDQIPEDVSLRRDLGVPPDAPLIGNVAALVDHKGHRFLIEAMPRVIEQVPGAHCAIVGEGPLRADLERRIREVGLEGRIHLAGWRDEIGACLRDFDVFCLSSHLEGLVTSLLDATLFGLPLVAFEAGGVPDVVIDGDTGWLVPNRDSEALAAALAEALTGGEEARQRAGRARRRTLDHFAIKRTAEKTLALWRRLAAREGSHER
jgi:glycosyltransferase involved in cell wall biosynthesis